jgi:inorganic pyrophosphatase
MEDRIWKAIDGLVESHKIVIDRPKGSPHPRYSSVIYPIDYGYLAGTRSGDLGGIDVWIGSVGEERVTAIVCTVDLNKSDAEVKFLIGCTGAEMGQILSFHNQESQSALLVERQPPER